MTALRLMKAYKHWPVGHVIPEMPGNVARSLIARGIGEEVKELASPADRMMRPGPVAAHRLTKRV